MVNSVQNGNQYQMPLTASGKKPEKTAEAVDAMKAAQIEAEAASAVSIDVVGALSSDGGSGVYTPQSVGAITQAAKDQLAVVDQPWEARLDTDQDGVLSQEEVDAFKSLHPKFQIPSMDSQSTDGATTSESTSTGVGAVTNN